MSVQLVYRAYHYTLQTRPGYTSAVSATSRTGSTPTQPPSQEQPDDKILQTKTDGRFSHVEDRSDLVNPVGYQYNIFNRFDPSVELMAALKLQEARGHAEKDRGSDDYRTNTLSDDTDQLSDDVKRSLTGTVTLTNQDWAQNDSIRMETDTVRMADRARFETNGQAGRSLTGRMATQAARGVVGQLPGQGRQPDQGLHFDFARDHGYLAPPSGTVDRDYIHNELNPGKVGPDLANADYSIYTGQVTANLLPHPLPIREPGDKKVAGVMVVDNTNGNITLPDMPLARVGVRGSTEYFTPHTIPEQDVKALNSPEYIAAGRRKSFRAAPGSRVPRFPALGRRVVTRQIGTRPLSISTRETFNKKMLPKAVAMVDRNLYKRSIAEYPIETEKSVNTQNRIPNLVSRHIDSRDRSEILVGTTVNRVGEELNLRQDYRVLNSPPSGVTTTVTSSNPFDYRAPIERQTLAREVLDEARNYRHLGSTRRQVNNVIKAVHNQKTKKIMEHDFYHRGDPRIQEVVTLKERVDQFSQSRSVEFEGFGKASPSGLPLYTSRGDVVQHATKGGSIDALTWGWGGTERER